MSNPGHNEKMMEVLFADIFRQHEHKLYSLVLKLTKSDQAAKDILQEVFLKLWTQRATLHTINNIEAWLCRITENKIIVCESPDQEKMIEKLGDYYRKIKNDNERIKK